MALIAELTTERRVDAILREVGIVSTALWVLYAVALAIVGG